MDEQKWLKWRKEGIGASEAPVIYLGQVFGTTKMKLYVKKLDTKIETRTNDNPDFRRGHTYEPLAARRFGEKTGIVTHYPVDDAERYGARYCLTDPDKPHRRVSLDAICDDGWLLEIKSPRQMSCDQIKAEGLRDYYIIQSAYQMAVAQKTGTFAWGPGQCKGVRLCIWEPESAEIITFEIPWDESLSELICESVDDFWNNHIVSKLPPFTTPAPQPISRKGGKYKQVDSDAWKVASQQYAVAKDSLDAATARLEIVKEQIIDAMEDAKLERIQLPSGIKFMRSEQQGRKGFDMDLLKHEHPYIDFDRYNKQGNPFKTFRVYGVRKVERDASDEEENRTLGLAVELAHFTKDKIDPELVFEAFEDLRSRTEMYTRALENEAETLKEQLKQAASSCTGKMFGDK